jgi:hypothetical protein
VEKNLLFYRPIAADGAPAAATRKSGDDIRSSPNFDRNKILSSTPSLSNIMHVTYICVGGAWLEQPPPWQPAAAAKSCSVGDSRRRLLVFNSVAAKNNGKWCKNAVGNAKKGALISVARGHVKTKTHFCIDLA